MDYSGQQRRPLRILQMTELHNSKICVVGLGYVGLPLAVAFADNHDVIAFDINEARVEALNGGFDSTNEVDQDTLSAALPKLTITSDEQQLADRDVFIITVPTPVDSANNPDLTPLTHASETVAKHVKPGTIIIYESTVFPGATEEHCAPIIERISGLTYNKNAQPGDDVFFLGYSPERINPGDKQRTLTKIVKVTSGSSDEVAALVDRLYKGVVNAGTYKAPSIMVAEAAKVIENIQRDVNIALINELALIFDRLEIDTEEVLKAAGTKWNFLNFQPGLVGGHCIGVDPYYLTYRAFQAGYHPEMILAGRRINEAMTDHIVDRSIKQMLRAGVSVLGSRVLVMGLTFKENCPDVRNSKVFDLIEGFQSYNCDVDVYDPLVDATELPQKTRDRLICSPLPDQYDAIIVTVGHDAFKDMGIDQIRSFGKKDHIVFDVKYVFPSSVTDARL